MHTSYCRSGAILLALVVATFLVALPAFAKKGAGGGGKPPPDDPPPPVNFNPVIATYGTAKHRGSQRDLIMVMDADGANKQVVVDGLDLGGWANGPAWSPDGLRIAVFGGAPGSRSYYIIEMEMDASGWTGAWHAPQELVSLELGAASYMPLDWHPDPAQQTIVYEDVVSAPQDPLMEAMPDIFLIDFTINGGQITASDPPINLTNTSNFREWSPSWSQNGARIAYYQQSPNDPVGTDGYRVGRIKIYDVQSGSASTVVLPSPLADELLYEVAWANGHDLLAVKTATKEVWCVDITDMESVTAFNLTGNLGLSAAYGSVGWTAGDTGVIYNSSGGVLNVLEFDLPSGRCPTDVADYQTTATQRTMTDSRFVTADWWRNAQ